MKELIHCRTKTSKTYDLGGGRCRLVISGLDPTLTVQPSAKDTLIISWSPDDNFGSLTYLYALGHETDTVGRSLLEFIISALPGGSTLNTATLNLYYFNWRGLDPVGETVWVYKLTRTDWVELEATWNIYKTSSSWTAAGGDFVTSAPSGGSTTVPADFGWMSWNVLAIVQDAYDSSNPAEFLLKQAIETGEDHKGADFYSKEYTTDPDLQPKLVIDYTPPPGWTGKISGVTNPAKIMGVDVANIKSVKGVE